MSRAQVRPWLPIILAIGSLTASDASAGPVFAYRSFDPPAGDQSPSGVSVAGGISNSGVIVGTYFTADSTARGYILDHGSYTYFDAPGAGSGNDNGTVGASINSAGQAIVESFDNNGVETTYLYARGSFTAFNSPLAAPGSTFATSISEKGVVTGYYYEASTFATRSFQYDTTTGAYSAVRDAPGSAESFAVATSTNGAILSYYYDGISRLDHIAVEQNGTFITLPDIPGSEFIMPVGISSSGVICGSYVDSSSNTHGFEYIAGAYYSIDYPGSAGTSLGGINDAGQAVGSWDEPSFEVHSLVVTAAVPEPFSLALCGIAAGLGLAVARARRGRDDTDG